MKYKKLYKTDYPPVSKPMLVWDGKCGFCHYWIIRWKKITGSAIDYKRYDNAAALFPDIPKKRFKEAVRLIEPDGRIYSGAEAAYRSLSYDKRREWIYRLYCNSRFFYTLSNFIYDLISSHRPVLYYISIFLWGRNPAKTKPYWLVYLVIILFLLFLIFTWKQLFY